MAKKLARRRRAFSKVDKCNLSRMIDGTWDEKSPYHPLKCAGIMARCGNSCMARYGKSGNPVNRAAPLPTATVTVRWGSLLPIRAPRLARLFLGSVSGFCDSPPMYSTKRRIATSVAGAEVLCSSKAPFLVTYDVGLVTETGTTTPFRNINN